MKNYLTIKRNFYIGSTGAPPKEGEDDYREEVRELCINLKAHVMHENTKHKGVFENVKYGDICFLKHKERIIAFGEVREKIISDDQSLEGWTYLIRVKEWFFYSKNQKEGVDKNGISFHTIGGDQYATIKQLDSKFSLEKIAQIAGDDNELFKQIKIEIKMEDFNSTMINTLIFNHNLILTGAPGTGKTYLAKQIASQIILGKEYDERTATDKEKKQMEEQCGFVQFHPSYDYTDFVEGLRPIKDNNGNVGFERRDGVFKDFCKKATTNTGFSFDDAYDRLIQDIQSGDLRTIKLKTKDSAELEVRSGNNIGWYSETEEGNKSSNVVSKDRLKKLFDVYNTLQKLEELSNINEGVQSIIGGCDSTYYWGVLHHILENYIFLKPYVFIIDEINRGEISKIFGELFYSIDPGYRGEKGKVNTQYQNLIDKNGDDVFKDGFYVPKNVYIIGTMNDIDRSVESMDFAMRRRFAFKEVLVENRIEMIKENEKLGSEDIYKEIKARMTNLNLAILTIQGLSTAYQIGAAYFLKLENYLTSDGKIDDNSWKCLWNNHLYGLLFEYLRGLPNADEDMKTLQRAYTLDDK